MFRGISEGLEDMKLLSLKGLKASGMFSGTLNCELSKYLKGPRRVAIVLSLQVGCVCLSTSLVTNRASAVTTTLLGNGGYMTTEVGFVVYLIDQEKRADSESVFH